jgi:adenylate kinase
VVFDGFPRTPAQAEALDKMLAGRKAQLDAVIEMRVDDEALVQRIAGRYSCKACGRGYHDTFQKPAKAGHCDNCGGTAFIRRPDDNEKTVRDRLEVYNRQTAPLVSYYAKTGKLHVIDGMADINAVTAEISGVLDGVAGK